MKIILKAVVLSVITLAVASTTLGTDCEKMCGAYGDTYDNDVDTCDEITDKTICNSVYTKKSGHTCGHICKWNDNAEQCEIEYSCIKEKTLTNKLQ
jgi:hypothetical protein